MDDMRIDSHKLIYHVDRLYNWMKGKNVCPISIEVSPTNLCNHRCIFCGLDYRAKRSDFIDEKALYRFVRGAAKKGTKAVVIAGEGEPLLNKKAPDFITFAKSVGVDAAVTTNGVLMDEAFCEKALKSLTWIRVSLDAGTPSTYEKIHRCSRRDFERVKQNLRAAMEMKKKRRLPVTIGTQFLLLKENAKDAEAAARLMGKIGVDYLIIKPYSKHPLSKNEAGTAIDYSGMLYLEKRLKRYSKGAFKVIFRKATMDKRFREKPYKRCLGSPFWAYISADGEVYPCNTFYGVKRFSYGNIKDGGFARIWNGRRRRQITKYMEERMDAQKCRELCRLDEINSYLWRIRHPHLHENFI